MLPVELIPAGNVTRRGVRRDSTIVRATRLLLISVEWMWLLLVALLFASPARAQCEVSGTASLDRIRVRVPPSQPIRTFAVSQVPIVVRPGRNPRYRDVRVVGPIAFEGRSDGIVPWSIRRAGTVAGGAFWMTPLVEIEEVVDDGEGGLLVRAQVAEDVWISRVHLPCAALVLGQGEDGRGDPPGFGARRGAAWQPRTDRVWLMSGRGEGASVRVDAPNGLPSPFIETERRGAWLHVVTAFSSGAALRGWVRESELRMARASRVDPRAFVRTVASPPHVCGGRGREVTIAAGTVVTTGPDGTAWATFPADTMVRISIEGSWARIVSIPGIFSDARCPEVLSRAWVPRTALRE
jgi:hypothetical protein